jgi:hypothetical protein
MTRVTPLLQKTLMLSAIVAMAAAAQQPVQFKASVKTKNGSDGTTSSGTMYFSGAKMRTDLTADSQNITLLADPGTKSQYVLMPSEKIYMQMPIGQGPVTAPIAGPTDPGNPCGGGSGNTDCVKGSRESVNGYDAVRWEYTNAEGVKTRAWVSTKLRFTLKLEDDEGSSTEFSAIAEGPQAASLFGIPGGYKKMDGGGMGMRGRGSAGSSDNQIASAMANLPPEAAAAMAAAMRGRGTTGPTGLTGPAGPTGSGWEKTKGWVVNLTVTGTGSKDASGESGTERQTYTVKVVASVPLNYGSPALGVPGSPGPRWQVIAAPGMGSPEALATPITFNVALDGKIDRAYKGACGIDEDPFTSVGIVKASAQKRGLLTKPTEELGQTQGLFKISGDLKTYDLMTAVGAVDVKETTETRIDGKGCRSGKPYTKTETKSASPQYSITIDLKGLPMPSAVGPVSGSKKMPMTIGGRQMDAVVNWTISPIP